MALRQEDFLQRAFAEMERLGERLNQLLVDVYEGAATWDDVTAFLPRFDYLQADIVTAERVLGMLSPWVPEVSDLPKGGERGRAVSLGADPNWTHGVALALRSLEDLLPNGGSLDLIPADEWRFPELEDAVKWLLQEKVVTAAQFRTLQAADQARVFSVPSINSVRTLNKLKEIVAANVAAGSSVNTFQKEMRQVVQVARHQEETLYRTQSKRAFLSGLDTTLAQPAIKKTFNYVVYSATSDPRTRPHHSELDGMVAEVGSPLYLIMRSVLSEYNCRCTMTPITRKRAEALGGPKTLDALSNKFKALKNAAVTGTIIAS